VQAVAVPALAHRITLRPEMWMRRVAPESIVADALAAVAMPVSGATPSYGTGA
jgi:MoxR-like ATPase